MSQQGIGALLCLLKSNAESIAVFTAALGKEIAALSLSDKALHFSFADGSRVTLYDDAQSCCESRFMSTDDALSDFIGGKLLDAEVREGPSEVDGEYGEKHEIALLR